ncbi:T9SS type A sorting domain-containing protein [Aequorivita sp. SDUM287046]|uniref:T9SS type A sorting domain-containing protein n=1 Tax=Aequorivita aurantiaca TaxID=3053356 RepID=A0ABT8DHG0_9FLAO|nr:T9SS type A sorting domain-containing protein [Aequorivita aurantiaca]MDN3723409.1 T9SS type A sorting domain-containing protein [Aequorivita aurantiaca]
MKNLLLFSTLLLTSTSIFAQLSVKPNGTADSYIYVKDQVLYVESDVNLSRNTNNTNTEASIYLRENGQLIQGEPNLGNGGDGQLSVQQNTPVTNPWAYYYWCSPIGNTGPVGSPVAPGNRWFGVSHLYEALPTSGITAAQQVATVPTRDGFNNPRLTISSRWLYTHKEPGTEAEGDYQRMNTGNAAPTGFGFTMKGVHAGTINNGGNLSNHDQLYEFRGRPNNGDAIIPVDANKMTLSGNPYPSALDLNKLFHDPTNVDLGTFWYYDEDRTVPTHYYSNKPYGYGIFTIGPVDSDNDPYNGNNLGTYAAAPFFFYNSSGNQGGGAGTSLNSDDNKRFAPIGQGIMFVGDVYGTVTIKNSHRVFFKEGVLGSVFQRPGADETANETNSGGGPTLSTSTGAIPVDYRTPILRLWSVFDEAVTRDLVLAFYDQATDGYDRGLDGLSAQDLQTDAYFPIGPDNARRPFAINGVKYDENKQIPIAFKIKNATQVRLVVAEEVKKPYQHVYLFDNQENTIQELSNSTASGVVLNLPAGTYDNRFFIVFRKPNLRPEAELDQMEVVKANVNLFQNNPIQKLEVSNPEGYTIKTAMVYDMNGKLVIQEKDLGSKNRYSFYTGNLSDGVYVVKLTTSEDMILDYKVIVHNK